MLGVTLGLATGCHRRREWLLVAVAGVAAALPDWDGLSLAFGADAYSRVHRAWGHNLLVAGTTGALVGAAGYLCHLSMWVQRATVRLLPKSEAAADPVPPAFSALKLAKWLIVGLLASLSHLPADLVYSGHPQMRSWPIQVFWPFSDQGWVWPLVAWGDLTTTLIFVGEMFALYCWPKRAQLIAVATLLGVLGYIGCCWLFRGTV
jgi:hypothetical protein